MNGDPPPTRTRIKVCGLCRREDALLAARLGADFLGLVLAESPRRVRPDEARPWVEEVRAAYPGSRWVGVFVRPSPSELLDAIGILGLDLVQIHGLRPDDRPSIQVEWIRAIPHTATFPSMAGSSAPWAVLVDHFRPDGSGGTGRSFDWSDLRDRWSRSAGGQGRPEQYRPRLFLAGGLASDNVGRAIRSVRPYAVDASSRLESSPGRKDAKALEAFFLAVRSADGIDADAPRPPDAARSYPRTENP